MYSKQLSFAKRVTAIFLIVKNKQQFVLRFCTCIAYYWQEKSVKKKKDIFQDVEYLQVNMKIFSIVCNESEWVVASQYQQCFYE